MQQLQTQPQTGRFRNAGRIGAIAILFSLVACSGMTPPAPDALNATSNDRAADPKNGIDGQAATSNRLKLTTFTLFEDKDDGDTPDNYFSNSYTRIVITSRIGERENMPGTGTAQAISSDQRGFFQRYMMGKKVDLNLSAKIRIGEYETTASLVTITHRSDKDGEHWDREIGHAMLNFPLFLVRPDGEANTPQIAFTFVGGTEYTSNIAASALQAVIAGIDQVSPDAGVLTKLTTQASKDKARAIDNSLQSLFSVGIRENHVSHRDLRKWKRNQGAAMTLWLPTKEGAWDDGKVGVSGQWLVSFAAPQPSIFSDWSICDGGKLRCANDRGAALANVHKEIKSGQVLAYTLVRSGNSLGTIKAYLTQQDWFVSAMADLKGNESDDRRTGENFCKNVHNTITWVGLNGDDADIVIRAVLEGLPLPNKVYHANTFKEPFCADAVRRAST